MLGDKRFCSRNALRFQAYPEAVKEHPSRYWSRRAKVSFDIRFLVPCGWQEFKSWLHACKTCKLKRFSTPDLAKKRPLNAWHNCRERRADVIAQAFYLQRTAPLSRRRTALIQIKTQLFTKFRGTFIELLSKRPFLSSKNNFGFEIRRACHTPNQKVEYKLSTFKLRPSK